MKERVMIVYTPHLPGYTEIPRYAGPSGRTDPATHFAPIYNQINSSWDQIPQGSQLAWFLAMARDHTLGTKHDINGTSVCVPPRVRYLAAKLLRH